MVYIRDGLEFHISHMKAVYRVDFQKIAWYALPISKRWSAIQGNEKTLAQGECLAR